jgi:hypothetical protein
VTSPPTPHRVSHHPGVPRESVGHHDERRR